MVDLVVNGRPCPVDAPDETPLLWVLRDQLGLRAAKYGCGLEQCGSCTVMVDGTARPSCRLPVVELSGQEVVTLEALREHSEGRRVVDALVGANAAQCGYCLPGIAVTLTWLVQRSPVSWDEAIRALDDHLCRCGSHPRILRVARELLGLGTEQGGASWEISAGAAPDEAGAAPDEAGLVVDESKDQRRRLGSLVADPEVDHWVDLSVEGRVRIRTGKVELGQGIRTALTVLAAEELGVDPSLVDVVPATTSSGPDEGFTAGSRSVEQSGVAVRQACAHALRLLVARAAGRLGVPADHLVAVDGVVRGPSGSSASYWDLAADGPFCCRVTSAAQLRPPADRRFVGKLTRRVDLQAKIGGEPVYVADFRIPGMRFARVLRPRHRGATLTEVPGEAVAGAQVVCFGDFVAVVAPTEGEAAAAAAELDAILQWQDGAPFPAEAADPEYMAAHVVSSYPIVDGVAQETSPGPRPEPVGPGAVVAARYTKPFLLHGSIGPSAAVALRDGDGLTVWSHSQGISFLRRALAPLVGLPLDRVTVHHLDGAGCYGHNGADDAACDAALVASALPGQPISLRWSRDDEHGNEPMGAAMVVDLTGSLGEDGRVATWCQDILTYRHSSRPVPSPSGTRLMAGWSLDPPIERFRAVPMLDFEAGGHRNGTPGYDLGQGTSIVKHDVDDGTALRTSALRGLGAPANVFAIESFMEELAQANGSDPLAFRLAHLTDPRARAVIEAAVDMAGGMEAAGGLDAPGRGLGYAQYENSMTYVAVVVELDVDPRTGMIQLRHAWIAADAGEVIDPDGLTNQLTGGFVQAASWTLLEQVRLDESGVASRDWESYPIMRFGQVPEIETRLLCHPGSRPLGAGESACGPTVAAIANAFFQHTGARLRDLPFDPPRVRAALDALIP